MRELLDTYKKNSLNWYLYDINAVQPIIKNKGKCLDIFRKECGKIENECKDMDIVAFYFLYCI